MTFQKSGQGDNNREGGGGEWAVGGQAGFDKTEEDFKDNQQPDDNVEAYERHETNKTSKLGGNLLQVSGIITTNHHFL